MQRHANIEDGAVDTLAALEAKAELPPGALSGTPADELEEIFEIFGVPTLGKIRIRAELKARVAGGGGGAMMAAPVGDPVALLQKKIEESSGTLRMLQGMGQKGAAITELHHEVRERQP